ncbi:hypothetical protein ASPWEDRAFT_119587 [Aspergillus wentii DTO 134E9]|uniref:Uncharacterized protein n=1 Tax=Aspergillus wentii DTO 134E9 TaxID=1073089 RepID=A0A1L9R9J3_ASPWE|nr:uncharacterized protein ASPWEDRAFT_119587 [Aspergillus wentii DTO 134E9]OJJ31558.1 hypothetical protein ASPWEDRAFT_119587 [Aspergillus wentii DTO 134E9]
MPKKRHNAIFANPTNTVHPTLLSSGPRNYQNDRSRSSQASSSTAEPSVNDLINHLRRTQVSRPSEDGTPASSRPIAPRSVHPSLRNLLELPETPPPRPRPGVRRVGVGGQRARRIAGPPPPESWLLGSNDANTLDDDEEALTAADTERVIYRLERLPGIAFPPKHSLLHMLLKSMGLHWAWHIEYDGEFLALLPSQIKVLLLSYIAVYARDQRFGGLMQGLGPLLKTSMGDDESDSYQETDLDISRLDLCGVIGRWMTFKQLTRELITSQKSRSASVQRTSKEAVPSSWEDDYEEDAGPSTGSQYSAIPKSLNQGLRFENLRFLSLAHPSPAAVNWNSLIGLLSRLSTLTHLSLAHWPVPTVTPNAINARIRHPTHHSLSFAYSGTDAYSAMENNWAEAAGVLRKLSRATYCLKWLDLEGCGDWIPALNWDGVDPDGHAYPSGSTGPEWNASWRDIEYIRLGPGWLPHIDDTELVSSLQKERETERQTSSPLPASSNVPASQSLASSMHAPSRSRGFGREDPTPPDSPDLPWDVEVERIKYRRSKELERYRELARSAKAVQRRIQQIRRVGRGKWVHFSFGFEELEPGVLKKLLGPEYSSFFP